MHWNFLEISVKILYAIIDWVCLSNKKMHWCDIHSHTLLRCSYLKISCWAFDLRLLVQLLQFCQIGINWSQPSGASLSNSRSETCCYSCDWTMWLNNLSVVLTIITVEICYYRSPLETLKHFACSLIYKSFCNLTSHTVIVNKMNLKILSQIITFGQVLNLANKFGRSPSLHPLPDY